MAGPAAALIVAGVGLGVYQASNAIKQGKREAESVAREGSLAAKNKAIQTMALASQQKVSFLGSGLLLEGTPLSVISSTYQAGKEDAQQIIANANARSSNIMSQARTSALSSILNGAMSGIQAYGGLQSLQGLGAQQGWWGGYDSSTGITWNSGRVS